MRIAIVSRGWWPSIKGGAEKFITRVAEELHSLGHEVIGVTREIIGLKKPQASFELIKKKESLCTPIFSSLSFSRWAANIVNDIKPEVVLVNAYWGEATPLFIKAKIPIVLIIHDVGLFKSNLARKNIFKYWLRFYVLRSVIKKANMVIVPTHVVKEDLVRYLNVDRRKIRVIGFEGIDGPMRRIHIENEYYDIVHPARYAPNKGQHITLKAFEMLLNTIWNARLIFVGSVGVSTSEKRYFYTIVEKAKKFSNRVKVLVNVEDMAPYYKIADVCVVPSLGEEGYGLTVAECMAYGKPVVVSDIFVETGVADPERTLIVPRGDPYALANALIKLWKDPYMAKELGMKGLEYVARYSWKKVAQLIEKYINELI